MPMKKNKIINIIIYIIIFSIGCCCGKLIDWGYFVLNKEISIIDAISLFLTIGCAIYISKVLEKEVQDVRIKVDDIKEVLDTNYKRLKPLLTDTSVMSKSPPDIEVKRGKITYSPERIVEIQENLQTIQDEFFKLKIIINRA